jgi:hypothetical protein
MDAALSTDRYVDVELIAINIVSIDRPRKKGYWDGACRPRECTDLEGSL